MKRNRLWIVLVVLLVISPLALLGYMEFQVYGEDMGAAQMDVGSQSEVALPEERPGQQAQQIEPVGVSLPGEADENWEALELTVDTVYDEKQLYVQVDRNSDGFELVRTYPATLPEGLIMDLDYSDYWIHHEYIVVLSGSVNIRISPSTETEVLKRGYYGEKYSLVETVRGQYLELSDSDLWHKIMWWEDEQRVEGYVYASIVSRREFRFQAMFDKITGLKTEVDVMDMAYIYNVGNSNGRAPLYKGAYTRDDFGVPRYQAAPAYRAPDWNASDMRYMQDGILLAIVGETGHFYKVRAFDYEGEYYVPKRYVTRHNAIETLRQVIVVDIANQNEGIFEFRDGQWHLISYSYATTGADTKYKEPTIPGSYQIINKQDYFRYRDDITRVIAGYAPYALRFNGGAFIHGVPVNYKLVRRNVVIQDEIRDDEGNVIQKAITERRIVNRIDPGHIEYSGSLGTVPLSHKCVRNITSHAKFLYDWVVLGDASVVVID